MNSFSLEVDGLLADPLGAGRLRAARGQVVIGVTSSDIPVELILAANAFPLALPCTPSPTPQADRYLEATFSPVARSLTEQWLSGQFDFLNAVVFPRSNDSLQRTYYYLCELQRRGLARGPRPLLFDVAKIVRGTSLAHTRAATVRLAQALQTDRSALSDAVAARNRRRCLMQRLLARRRSNAPPPGPLAERIARAADFGDAAPFDAALEAWLGSEFSAWHGPRLLLAGSPPPDDRWHTAAEECGARIVDEFGDHAADRLGAHVMPTGDPIEAIGEHHARLRAGSRSFEDRAATLVERARAARVDGVVLWIIEEDESIVWDVPAMKRALSSAKIPLLELTRRAWNEDAVPEIAGFVKHLDRKP
jgi:benzoyl-CoA reductase/2-hydroxyglutaryl-CoA dehydratase subunit BcrC/BadD/HgdB